MNIIWLGSYWIQGNWLIGKIAVSNLILKRYFFFSNKDYHFKGKPWLDFSTKKFIKEFDIKSEIQFITTSPLKLIIVWL
jgi:hypothetical protein